MSRDPAQIVFPASARAMQERFGSRAAYAKRDGPGGFPGEVTSELAAFLGERNSFYMATASRDGQPYIQHRGGPKGFLRVLGPSTLGFADFAGNRQYITIGHLSENAFCHLFLIDYAAPARVKIWCRARVAEDDPALLDRLVMPDYRARVERAIVIEIDAWDFNCRQHIPQRLEVADVAATIDDLEWRIRVLETENAALRERAAAATP